MEDFYHSEEQRKYKKAKRLALASLLIGAAFAIAIGLFVFIQNINTLQKNDSASQPESRTKEDKSIIPAEEPATLQNADNSSTKSTPAPDVTPLPGSME